MEIKIKYFSDDYPRLEKIEEGDWVDLRVNSFVNHEMNTGVEWEINSQDTLSYKTGDVIKIGLGIAMELPKGYEALVSPRSSTFKHWKIIQTNSTGVIDNSYCGDNDEWMIEFIALANGTLERFDRISQFRVIENQPNLSFREVESLNNDDRGGYGTTGKD